VSIVAAQKLNNFFSKFKKYYYKKGEMILRGGDTPQGVYFIDNGYVKDCSISKEGEELTLIIFKPEDFFPMQWVFNTWLNNHYFEAITSVELWRCPKEDFITFIKANPDVFFELTGRIMLRLGGLLQRMEYLAFGNSYEKVASMILICAERFGKKIEKNIVIQVPFTHKDIASFLGLARETASIEIKKLERKGLIAYRNKLIVVENMNKLKQESLLTNP
jgi:CRP-like cAMP-binding protein